MLGCGLYDLSLPDVERTNAFQALSYSALITFFLGVSMVLLSWQKFDKISRREGVVVVGLGWIVSALMSALPYCLCLPLPCSPQEKLDVFSSIFEATSGITATGSTNLADIECWPKALLLWRATTQWLGGLGILVIFVGERDSYQRYSRGNFTNLSNSYCSVFSRAVDDGDDSV